MEGLSTQECTNSSTHQGVDRTGWYGKTHCSLGLHFSHNTWPLCLYCHGIGYKGPNVQALGLLFFFFFFDGTDGFSSCQRRHLGFFVPSFFFYCSPYTHSIYCVSGVVDIKEQLWLLGGFFVTNVTQKVIHASQLWEWKRNDIFSREKSCSHSLNVKASSSSPFILKGRWLVMESCEISRPIESTVCCRLLRWMSDISELESERSSCQARLENYITGSWNSSRLLNSLRWWYFWKKTKFLNKLKFLLSFSCSSPSDKTTVVSHNCAKIVTRC